MVDNLIRIDMDHQYRMLTAQIAPSRQASGGGHGGNHGPVTAKPDDFFLAWSEMEEQAALLQIQA